MMRPALIAILILLMTTPVAIGQGDSLSGRQLRQVRKDQAYQQIKDLVESGSFQFVAVWGQPQGGGRMDLNGNNNYVRIENNEVETFLQYFGRIYNGRLANANNGGILFKGDMENWEVRYDEKKRKINYRFTHKTGPETYELIMRIGAGGGASVTVSSSARDFMSFDGYIEGLPAVDNPG